ncbi:MAG: hypothetical protein ACRC92_26685 [Peptostreptococcaceae bacterium]
MLRQVRIGKDIVTLSSTAFAKLISERDGVALADVKSELKFFDKYESRERALEFEESEIFKYFMDNPKESMRSISVRFGKNPSYLRLELKRRGFDTRKRGELYSEYREVYDFYMKSTLNKTEVCDIFGKDPSVLITYIKRNCLKDKLDKWKILDNAQQFAKDVYNYYMTNISVSKVDASTHFGKHSQYLYEAMVRYEWEDKDVVKMVYEYYVDSNMNGDKITMRQASINCGMKPRFLSNNKNRLEELQNEKN